MNNSETAHAVAQASPKQHAIIKWLKSNILMLLEDIRHQEFWEFILSPESSEEEVAAIMREIYLDICGYQPDVIEAAIASIGQMPRSMDPRHVKAMLVHQGDEFDHGEMAFRDFVGIGGRDSDDRSDRMSPEAFAVAGVWWMIVQKRDPFAYLGALYLFEGLTPTVTGMVKEKLKAKGFTAQSLEYIEFHSTEDIKHANLVDHLITQVATAYPESVDSIKHGFECFRAVYPIPLWTAAFRRAKQSAK